MSSRSENGRKRGATFSQAWRAGGTRIAQAAALHLAKVTGATLVIAKLDRAVVQRGVPADAARQRCEVRRGRSARGKHLTVGIVALVAQAEREAISKRTKEALAVARSRGVSWATRTAQRRSDRPARVVRRSGRPSRGTPTGMLPTWRR